MLENLRALVLAASYILSNRRSIGSIWWWVPRETVFCGVNMVFGTTQPLVEPREWVSLGVLSGGSLAGGITSGSSCLPAARQGQRPMSSRLQTRMSVDVETPRASAASVCLMLKNGLRKNSVITPHDTLRTKFTHIAQIITKDNPNHVNESRKRQD